MNYHIAAARQAQDEFFVPNIALHEAESAVILDVLQVEQKSLREIIQPDDGMPVLQQGFGQV